MSTINEILERFLPKYSKNFSLVEKSDELDNLELQIEKIETLKSTNSLIAKETLDQLVDLDHKVQTLSPNPQTKKIHTIFQKIIETNSDRFLRLPSSTIPLDPPMPTEPNSVDIEKLQEWGRAHPKDCQETAKAVGECIRVIDHDEFSAAVSKSVADFNSYIDESSDKSFHVITCAGKSNSWIASWAITQLKNLPKDAVEIGKNDRYGIEVGYQEWLEKHEVPKKVVFFDDASYSGSQLVNFVEEVMKKSETKKSLPEIHIVCAYMTNYAENYVSNYFKTHYPTCNVIIHAHERILSIDEALQEKYGKEKGSEYSEKAKQMWWPGETFHPEANYQANGPKTRGNVILFYKIPDNLSFPDDIRRGCIRDGQGKILKGNSWVFSLAKRQMVSDGIIFINENCKPPYKR